MDFTKRKNLDAYIIVTEKEEEGKKGKAKGGEGSAYVGLANLKVVWEGGCVQIYVSWLIPNQQEEDYTLLVFLVVVPLSFVSIQ